MDPQTKAINTTLTMVGALILLAVLTWVVFTISQPLIPNTGGATSTPEIVMPTNSTNISTSSSPLIESVDTKQGDGGGADDPTGKSHSE
jgi:hypothetical protein